MFATKSVIFIKKSEDYKTKVRLLGQERETANYVNYVTNYKVREKNKLPFKRRSCRFKTKKRGDKKKNCPKVNLGQFNNSITIE